MSVLCNCCELQDVLFDALLLFVLAAAAVSYKYDWKLSEATKNIMRTHTTGVSARMLYQLAQEVCAAELLLMRH